MGKPSKKEKYSATYCWIRCTYLYPAPAGPGPSCPGPGRKRRRSLAGGLVWVLLGLVWLGSPFIIRLSQCSTDVMNNNERNEFGRYPTNQPSNEQSFQSNNIKSAITVNYNQRKIEKIKQQQQQQQDNYNNQHQHYHHHQLAHHHHHHHPVQLINANDLKSDRHNMEKGNEVIQKKLKTTCPNCIVGFKDAELQSKSNKIRNRFQSSKSTSKYPPPTFSPINIDSIRLEAIKHQILSKLGLKSKPKITHEFSKQTILNTLSRADDMNWQNDEIEKNSRNYNDYLKLIDRHLFDSNSINTNSIINHYDFVTSKNHITNNMNATFTKNHIIKDNDRINTDIHNNKNLMDTSNNINTNSQHHITHKHHTSYHPSKSKNHLCSQPDKHTSSTSATSATPLNQNNHKNNIPSHRLKVQRNRTTINEQKDFYKINNFSDISDHSDNNLLFVNEDSYHIDGQLLQRHELHQQPEQLNYPSDNLDSDQDDYFGRTREVITFAEQGYLLNGQRLIEFSTNQDRVSGKDLRVRAAVLWIKIELRSNYRKFRRKNIGNLPDRSLTLWVFRVMESYVPSNSTILADKEFDRRTELIKSKSLDLSKLGWQKFDITYTVRKWYAEGDKKCLRLLVDCSGCGDRVDLHLFNSYDHSHSENRKNQNPSTNKSLNYVLNVPTKLTGLTDNSPNSMQQQTNDQHATPNRPFLVVFVDPNVMKRVRRRAFDCSGAPAGQCCKQKFYVSFRELGWDDWIIAPHGYYANYCKGDCSGLRTPDKFQSYHSHVIEEYRKIDRLSGIQPCCAPIKFSSMSLIYYEENKKIVKRDLPKMIVEECGCP